MSVRKCKLYLWHMKMDMWCLKAVVWADIWRVQQECLGICVRNMSWLLHHITKVTSELHGSHSIFFIGVTSLFDGCLNVQSRPTCWWRKMEKQCIPAWVNEALCGKIYFEFNRQKYEARSKFFMFTTFFLTSKRMQLWSTNTFFTENVERQMCYGTLASWLAHRSTHKIQTLTAQISVKLFWIVSYLTMFKISQLLKRILQKIILHQNVQKIVFTVYYNEVLFPILILPSKSLI